VYGPVPPLGVAVAVPLQEPKHVTLVLADVALSTDGTFRQCCVGVTVWLITVNVIDEPVSVVYWLYVGVVHVIDTDARAGVNDEPGHPLGVAAVCPVASVRMTL
jgi:hypothetical protein